MIAWLLGNAAIASVAALIVALVCRFKRDRPELCHGLWLFVFALLVMPPLPINGHPGQALRAGLTANLADSTPAPPPTATTAPAPAGLALRPVPFSLRPTVVERTPLPLPSLTGDPALAPRAAFDPPAPARFPIHPALLGGGIVALLALLSGFLFAARITRFHRGVKAAPRATQADPALQAAVERVATRLGVPAPEVRLVPGIGSPAVWCLGRARLLWPATDRRNAKAQRRSLANQPTVIAHELAHIARRDTWVARAEPLAMLLLFWHPLFWIVRNRVHHFSELACDAWALWAYPDDRRAYAEALVDSHDQNRTARVAVRGLCATHPNLKDLERRLTLIMKHKVQRGTSRMLFAASAAVALTVAPGLSQDRVVEVEDTHKASQADEWIIEEVAKGDAKQHVVWLDAKSGTTIEVVEEVEHEHEHEHEHTSDHKPAPGTQAKWVIVEEDGKRRFELADAEFHETEESVVVGNGNAFAILGQDGEVHIQSHGNGSFVANGTNYFMTSGPDEQSAKHQAALAKALGVASQAFAQGDYEKALPAYAKVIELQPDHGLAHAQSAYMLIGQGQYDAARKHLKEQLAAGYRPDFAHYNFACCASLSGDQAAAAKHLSAALRVGFQDVELLESDADLAGMHGSPSYAAAVKLCELVASKRKAALQGTNEERLAALKVAAKIASEDGALLADLGMAYHNVKDYKNSLATWQRQAELGHNVGMATYNVACSQALLGQTDAAMGNLFKAAELGFTYPPAAEDSDLESLRSHPDYAAAIDALAARSNFVLELEELMASGQYEMAEGEVEWLLAEEDLDSEARGWANFVSGDIKRALGAQEEARAAYERALGEDYDRAMVAQELAAVLSELGREDEALEQRAVAEMYAKEAQRYAELAEDDALTAAAAVEQRILELQAPGKLGVQEALTLQVAELKQLAELGYLEVELEEVNADLERALADLHTGDAHVIHAAPHNVEVVDEVDGQLGRALAELEAAETRAVAKENKQLADAKRKLDIEAAKHERALRDLEVELLRAEREMQDLELRRAALDAERAALEAKAKALKQEKKQAAKKSPQ